MFLKKYCYYLANLRAYLHVFCTNLQYLGTAILVATYCLKAEISSIFQHIMLAYDGHIWMIEK